MNIEHATQKKHYHCLQIVDPFTTALTFALRHAPVYRLIPYRVTALLLHARANLVGPPHCVILILMSVYKILVL